MKFEKIIIPPGWQESFTKYPNGKTIFEALSHTITTVNEGIEEVNEKVNQGLVAIEQAENIIRQEITESFNTLKLQLEGEIDELSNDLIADFALLQSDVLTLIAGKANAGDVYTKQQVDAQLSGKVDKVTGKGLSTNDFDNTYKQKIDTDIPAQLADKVQNFKLKNEVVNGDFSNPLTLWTPRVGYQTIVSIEAGRMKCQHYASVNYGGADYPISIPNANKIYFKLAVEAVDGFYVNFGGQNIFSPLQGVHTFSAVASSNGSSNFSVRHSGTAVTYYVDNVIIVNLTSLFGAGNEPTKLEMDELMKVIPNGWWNGELTLTQKQFITWQLNLIRKNTNAIIALGGTII